MLDPYTILEAIATAESLDDAEYCLKHANAYWSTNGQHCDDVLDAAQYCAEAMRLRLAGHIALALKREASLDRILSAYGI